MIFKNIPQGQSIPTSRESGKNARRPAWMYKKLLAKLEHKKVVHIRKHGQVR